MSDLLDVLAAVARALLYVGVLSCAGTVFAQRILKIEALESRAIRIIYRSAWLTIAAVVAAALILMLRLGGLFDDVTFSAVFMSSYGAAAALQLAGASLLLATLRNKTAQGMQLVNAILLTLSFALSGHAPAADLADGFIVFVHASMAAWWIGSLWLLRAACESHSPLAPDTLVALVRRFSVAASLIIGVLVITGLVLIAALLSFETLRFSAYEKTLLIKIGIAIVVLGVAAFNKFRLTPQLNVGDKDAAGSLRQMIHVELGLIALVLAVTAVLTTYMSPPE